MASKRPYPEGDSRDEVEAGNSEETFSMVDILAEQNALEESASAVLGSSDDKNCTYPLGYMKRQALYSCRTCADKGPVGVCLACCLVCHENHDLVELYTKRNFCCDCGNGKFPDGFKCQLDPNKSDENADNRYNQNFDGTYCTCIRPYPDPEEDVEDDMIQCCVCEDWLHTRHLGEELPAEYAEMVCDSCVSKHNFIHVYWKSQDLVNVEEGCFLKLASEKMKDADGNQTTTSCFFKEHWRSKLCKCSECLVMYDEKNITFLNDENDAVDAYEKKGFRERKSQYEKGMEELSKLNRVQQVEVLSEFDDMKSELKDFLGGLASSGKVVTKEHITQFFEDMKNRKRRKVSVPLNCR